MLIHYLYNKTKTSPGSSSSFQGINSLGELLFSVNLLGRLSVALGLGQLAAKSTSELGAKIQRTVLLSLKPNHQQQFQHNSTNLVVLAEVQFLELVHNRQNTSNVFTDNMDLGKLRSLGSSDLSDLNQSFQ